MAGMNMRKAPGRPIEVDPESIALIATQLFDDRGVEAVTMTEIADAAGVSRRTLFRWFPTKASLVWGGTVEAAERFERGWVTARESHSVLTHGAEGNTPTLINLVREAYAASISPLGETSDITRLRLKLIDRHPEVFAAGHELRMQLSHHLSKHLADELNLPNDSLRVTTLAAAITSVSHSALAWWARTDDQRPPAEVLDEALRGLASLFD